MRQRFTYSRWDGTQKGFDLDADAILSELTDDLLYHGDVNAALRRLMRSGMTDADGNRIEGLSEMLERIRERRQEIQDSGDLGGVYSEIADALNDIVDEERHAIEQARKAAEQSGDERRAQTAQEAATERNFRLDMMPDDLAGKVRELQAYDFESQEAKRRFDELMESLREQMMQQMLDQMKGDMERLTPEDMQRMKDMIAELNNMIERRNNGEDPQFEQFMEKFGDFFPENPQSLDELLEIMAQRMQAMQAMLNSMTPEQRAQLQELSDQLMQDMDLQWQMQQLGEHLQNMFPQQGWGREYQFDGTEQMSMNDAVQAMQNMGQLDQLENLIRNASNPAALAEADLDRVRDLLGDDAARSMERLAKIAKLLEEAGLVNRKEGKLELSPRGLRAIGNNSLRELFSKMSKDKFGQHRIEKEGVGHERTAQGLLDIAFGQIPVLRGQGGPQGVATAEMLLPRAIATQDAVIRTAGGYQQVRFEGGERFHEWSGEGTFEFSVNTGHAQSKRRAMPYLGRVPTNIALVDTPCGTTRSLKRWATRPWSSCRAWRPIYRAPFWARWSFSTRVVRSRIGSGWP